MTPAVVLATLLLNRPGPAISPLIFGVSHAKEELRTGARIPLERWGGNRSSRFDWKTGNDAAGNDWFFANGGANAASPDTVWYHAALKHNAELGIETLVTVPTIGWVARDNSSASFLVSRYGPQKRTDTQHPDWGNGERPDGTPITRNDPTDAGKRIDAAYIGEFVAYLKATYGPASGPVRRAYALDNEPGLWHSTHRDVHPAPVTYDEAWRRTVEYASAIKDADPSAQVWGPVEWGWLGLKYSAADSVPGKGFAPAPDSKAHGADYFLHWYIRQLADYRKKTGRLLVDVIDVHDYPEVYVTGEGRIVAWDKPDGGSPVMQRARLEAVRTWWDPTYKANGPGWTTWIDEPMYLLRRIQGWIKAECPELKLAVTEWDFGGRKVQNGALVHALIFQALMQEGAYAAAEWGTPGPADASFHTYALFRNYDGKGAAFTGTYIPGESSDPAVTVFGALDAGAKRLRVIVVNTDPAAAKPVSLNAGKVSATRVGAAWVLANTRPPHLEPVKLARPRKGRIAFNAPAYSVSLLDLPL